MTAINTMTGPETSAAEQSRMELQARLNGLGGLSGKQLSPEAKARKLREACEGFESIFIQKMWQEMRNAAVPKDGLLHSREEGFWQDMYDQELSKSMTKAGGIGLADMMYEQLSRNLVSASRSAAGSSAGGAFTPGAAPLVPQGEMEDLIGGTLKASAEDIYESVEQESAPAEAPAPIQVAQFAAAPATPAQSAPVEAPYAAIPKTSDVKPHHKVGADLGQSNGLLQARKAFREAGDKLGSRAVRPAASPQKQMPTEDAAPVFTSPVNQEGLQPGSPEALRVAVEKARTGNGETDDGQVLINLHNLVANVQSGNYPAAEEAQPIIKRVRRTTNIPQNSGKTAKKNNQAIRTLNVNNVGVNSRQGQGLSAYHRQQETAAQLNASANTAATTGASPLNAASQGDIPPLTVGSQNIDTTRQAESFAIPPLTASAARS